MGYRVLRLQNRFGSTSGRASRMQGDDLRQVSNQRILLLAGRA
jgi:hypothetical protein